MALFFIEPNPGLKGSLSRLPARSLLLLRRGVHRTPATSRASFREGNKPCKNKKQRLDECLHSRKFLFFYFYRARARDEIDAQHL